MKPEIVLVGPLMPEVMADLDAAFVVHRLYEAVGHEAWLAGIADRVRGLATDGANGCDGGLMDALPGLEIISINGVGFDAVDLPRARDRGIRVTNTPDVLTDDVADMALALALAVSRRICVGDRHVRNGGWEREGPMPLTRKVTGARIGILGLGRVGQAVARRFAGLDCKIGYTDLQPREDLPHRYFGVLTDLAAWSDILIVCAAGGPGTHNLIGRAELDALGPDGTLINVARGTVVDEPALVSALTEGRLGAAGLDVFADEPRVPSALLAMDQVVVQPHAASGTRETRLAMGRLVVDNLRAHFGGRPLLTPVT